MNTGFEDSLNGLKLEDGIEGVQRLKPADEVWEFLPNPARKHLHIAVECPMTGELQTLIVKLGVLTRLSPAYL
jgi:hypothetical protein